MKPLLIVALALACSGCALFDLPIELPGLPGQAPGLPSAGTPERLHKNPARDVKATAVAVSKAGYLLSLYDNKSRKDSWIVLVSGGSARTLASTRNETIGTPALVSGKWTYAMESDAKEALYLVDDASSAVSRGIRAADEYATVCVAGHIAYANPVRLVGPAGDELHRFKRLDGIVSGMAARGHKEWICAVMDGKSPGIESTSGWFVPGAYPEVAVVGDQVVGFAKNGEVHLIDGGKVSKVVAATGRKPQRAVVSGGLVYWVTADPDELWVSNLSDSKRLAEWSAGDASNGASSGSLFNCGLALDGGFAVVVRSVANGGVELWRVPLD